MEPEVITLREHLTALMEANDRRYAEVSTAKEKAADIALKLSEETQKYKDEKANELREQINRERVLYATKEDLKSLADKIESNMKPLAEFMARQQGGSLGRTGLMAAVGGAVALLLGIIAIFAFLDPPASQGSGRVTVESTGGGRPDAQLQVTPE